MRNGKSAIYIIKLLLIVLIFSGCSYESKTTATQNISGILPTTTSIPTKDNEVVLPTITETITTNSEQPSFKYESIKIVNNIDQLPTIVGSLVLANTSSYDVSNIIIWDMVSKKEIEIPNEYVEIFAVSPKMNYLAYSSSSLEQDILKDHGIIIMNSDGTIIDTLSDIEPGVSFKWKDEQELMINSYMEENPLILYSPFTKSTQTILPYFQESEIVFFDKDLIRLWNFYAQHKNVYNPTFTRVIFPTNDEQGPKIVLRDLTSETDLASFPTYIEWGVDPSWSTNGDKFAIGIETNPSSIQGDFSKYEIFLIDQNGDLIQKTNYASISDSFYILYLSWSPDNRYIAFSFSRNTDNYYDNIELGVFDTSTQETAFYQITTPSEYVPIWSPDSRFIVLKTAYPKENGTNSLIIDITTNQGLIIKEGYEPIGWLN